MCNKDRCNCKGARTGAPSSVPTDQYLEAQEVILYPMTQKSITLPVGPALNGVRLHGDSMHSSGSVIKAISVGPRMAFSLSAHDSRLPRGNVINRWDGFDVIIDRQALESAYGGYWSWRGPVTVTLLSGKGGRVFVQRL